MPQSFESSGLKIYNAGCAYGMRPVFTGLTVTWPAGSLAVISGYNGAGKTTFLRCISGLHPAFEGEIIYNGKSCSPWERRQMCHWISATPSLKDHMGVYESLHFLATIKSGQALSDQDIQTALEKMGIAHLGGCLCGQLSAGQKMRVMLALLLLVRRPVWLLDEAGSVLDSKGREILQSIIRFHIRDHKGIVVLASHDTNLFEPDYKLEFGR